VRTAIFIDGAYLGSILRQHYARETVAFDRLAMECACGGDILRSYYYDAPPWQSNPPTADESKRFAARQRFFDSLRRLDRYEVREGRCARVWDRDRGDWKYQQKRVDVLFSVDLVRLASKGKIERAVMIAGDSDFLPAVSVAKDEGVSILLVHSPDQRQVHRDLWQAADQRRSFDAAFLAKVRR
jgi:uncharacterized LabA/DUF88 family protein